MALSEMRLSTRITTLASSHVFGHRPVIVKRTVIGSKGQYNIFKL